MGFGFEKGLNPTCRFTIGSIDLTTSAQLISRSEMTCVSPAFDVPEMFQFPLEVAFSISMTDSSAGCKFPLQISTQSSFPQICGLNQESPSPSMNNPES